MIFTRKKCKTDNVDPVSSNVYRTFCTEYNYAFHKPKKDACSYRNTFLQKERTGNVSEIDKTNYDNHLKRKDEAMNEKERYRDASKQNKSLYTATFDLQAVLYTLCSNVSKVFYKRKLNCYNLTYFLWQTKLVYVTSGMRDKWPKRIIRDMTLFDYQFKWSFKFDQTCHFIFRLLFWSEPKSISRSWSTPHYTYKIMNRSY